MNHSGLLLSLNRRLLIVLALIALLSGAMAWGMYQ